MRCISLLSGGLDAVVATTCAVRQEAVELALTCDYGQRAAPKEIAAAQAVCRELGIAHRVVDLRWLGQITKTALVNTEQDLPELTVDALADLEQVEASAEAVWVPNRNGVFLNVAAAFAESLDCAAVVVGFNAEEGQTFPDNTSEFTAAATQALSYSTLSQVRVWSPVQGLTKTRIVKLGYRLNAPLQHIWSCYGAGPEACGVCESCLRLARALRQAEEME